MWGRGAVPTRSHTPGPSIPGSAEPLGAFGGGRVGISLTLLKSPLLGRGGNQSWDAAEDGRGLRRQNPVAAGGEAAPLWVWKARPGGVISPHAGRAFAASFSLPSYRFKSRGPALEDSVPEAQPTGTGKCLGVFRTAVGALPATGPSVHSAALRQLGVPGRLRPPTLDARPALCPSSWWPLPGQDGLQAPGLGSFSPAAGPGSWSLSEERGCTLGSSVPCSARSTS